MAAVTTQPTGGSAQGQLIHGNRDWANSLYSCCEDLSTTCYVYWCQPCALCNMAKRLGETCSCMPLCVPSGSIAMRAKLRTVAGIRGTVCDDCVTMSFCSICALVQMSREMDAMGL